MPSAKQSIRARLADAHGEADALTFEFDPHPLDKRNGISAGAWEGAPRDNLPPDCPVQVLGYSGEIIFCLGANRQLYEVDKFDKPTLQKLFAPYTNYLYWAWPSVGKKPARDDDETPEKYHERLKREWPVRLQADQAAECLLNQAARAGLFDPSDQVRGRGGWKDSNGAFFWHSGSHLYRSRLGTKGARKRERLTTGMMDERLYLLLPSTLTPWPEAIDETSTPADMLLKLLLTWSWERPTLDPVMLLGWIVASLMGSALDWRPIVFTTGGAGVGKSSLHALVQAILGDALHATADTTPAGIYQRVKNDCLPVTVDELEAKANDGRARGVIELARLASSGSQMFRGGADHNGHAFQLRNTFMFSAINPPPLNDQDKSRMAVLNLGKIDKSRVGAALPVLTEEVGRQLLRQVIDGWEQFYTKLLPEWKAALHGHGFDSRAADTYGTLLAAAELVVGAEVLQEIGMPMHDDDAMGAMVAEATHVERSEQLENWHKCIQYILNAQVDEYRSGERRTVGQVLEGATAKQPDTVDPWGNADKTLKGMQLRVVKPGSKYLGGALFIPHARTATGLAKALVGTEFHEGVWSHALKQAPDYIVRRGPGAEFQKKIGVSAMRGLLIDLQALVTYERKLDDDDAADVVGG